jgi:hypothetical protein
VRTRGHTSTTLNQWRWGSQSFSVDWKEETRGAGIAPKSGKGVKGG